MLCGIAVHCTLHAGSGCGRFVVVRMDDIPFAFIVPSFARSLIIIIVCINSIWNSFASLQFYGKGAQLNHITAIA